jgi:hypothetical protein
LRNTFSNSFLTALAASSIQAASRSWTFDLVALRKLSTSASTPRTDREAVTCSNVGGLAAQVPVTGAYQAAVGSVLSLLYFRLLPTI